MTRLPSHKNRPQPHLKLYQRIVDAFPALWIPCVTGDEFGEHMHIRSLKPSVVIYMIVADMIYVTWCERP